MHGHFCLHCTGQLIAITVIFREQKFAQGQVSLHVLPNGRFAQNIILSNFVGARLRISSNFTNIIHKNSIG